MRDGPGVKRFPHFFGDIDGTGKEAYRQRFFVARFGRRENGGRLFLDGFEGEYIGWKRASPVPTSGPNGMNPRCL